jgi:hypothetical protein
MQSRQGKCEKSVRKIVEDISNKKGIQTEKGKERNVRGRMNVMGIGEPHH